MDIHWPKTHRFRSALFWIVAGLLVVFLLWGTWGWHSRVRYLTDAPSSASLPTIVRDHGYVSSEACRTCHPEQYDSWHASYHRTMTQTAMPETVLASFNNVTLEAEGKPYRFERRGDSFWVELNDPDIVSGQQRVERRVVMVTGSHHQQRYWLASGKGKQGKRLDLLPFA